MQLTEEAIGAAARQSVEEDESQAESQLSALTPSTVADPDELFSAGCESWCGEDDLASVVQLVEGEEANWEVATEGFMEY